MSREVKIITNGNGSGDWVVVEIDGQRFYEGHSIRHDTVVDIIRELGVSCTYDGSLTDDQILSL